MGSQEIWQVAVQDKVYEAELEEMIQWIKEGSILPEDKVRRGNLRWLDAGKIPELKNYFQKTSIAAEETDLSLSPVAEMPENVQVFTHFQIGQENPEFRSEVGGGIMAAHGGIHTTTSGAAPVVSIETNHCSVHADRDYEYVCEICGCFFCKDCPNTFGSNVKICLSCGGLCVERQEFERRGNKIVGSINKPYPRVETQVAEETKAPDTKLRTADLLFAFRYPLRYPLTLALCAALCAALVAGQALLAVGGSILLAASSAITLLFLVLTFSVMFKTIENAVQNKPELNFLPPLNRYTFWEDYIHPVFTGAAVYLVSFFLFIVLALGAGAYSYATYADTVEKVRSEADQSQKSVSAALKSVQSGASLGYQNPDQSATDNQPQKALPNTLASDFTDLFGTDYLADTTQLERVVASFMRLSVYFHMPVFFAFLLGVLIFPAVCAVAGSTRSAINTFDVSLACKIIKDFGFDYVKIVSLTVILAAVTLATAAGIYRLFSLFDLRLFGLVTAMTAGSVLFFYFWTALSSVLGTVIFKNQEPENQI